MHVMGVAYLERAQTQEAQAKQDSELAELRVKEMEQGIANDASSAAKTQLEVAKERHAAMVAELKSVKDELEALKGEHATLANEKDMAIGKAEESISVSKMIVKTVEDLTLELITTKELLGSAQATHLEAEEQRITVALAREQDNLSWESELKQAEGEPQHLNELLLLVNNLKTKLDAACTLLFNLKVELAAYKEAKVNQESDSTKEVKTDIEKAREEVNHLRVSASPHKCELERETTALITLRLREGLASAGVSSLEAGLNRTTRWNYHVRQHLSTLLRSPIFDKITPMVLTCH